MQEEKSRSRHLRNTNGRHRGVEVLGHRQPVFKSEHDNPVKAVQRELTTRRPEVQSENSRKYHAAANGMVENAVREWVDQTGGQ